MKKQVLSLLVSVAMIFSLMIPFQGVLAAEPEIGWSANPTGDQLTSWWYYGKNNAGEVVAHELSKNDTNCPISLGTVTPNYYDGASFSFTTNFPEGNSADAAHVVGYEITINIDKYPYLYLGVPAFASNFWIHPAIGSSLQTPNIGQISDAAEKVYTLSDYVTSDGGDGEEKFWITFTLVDGAKAGGTFNFNYLYVGNQEATPEKVLESRKPAFTTEDPNIAWSASMSDAQKADWWYYGKNNAGNVASHELSKNDENCPVTVSNVTGNAYQGAGFDFNLTFPEGNQADPYHTVGYKVTVDLNQHSYLYLKNGGLKENVWFEIKFGEELTTAPKHKEINGANADKYDLKTILGKEGKQTFWVVFTLIDGGKASSTFHFDYLFIGNEEADPSRVVSDSDIGWSANIEAQKSDWHYFGKNTAGTVVAQPLTSTDADFPLIVTPGDANDFDGTAFKVNFDWDNQDSQADFYQRLGIKVTIDLDKYPYLYAKTDYGRSDLLQIFTAKDLHAGEDFHDGETDGKKGTRVYNVGEHYNGGVQTFWLIVCFQDMNYNASDFNLDYLFFGNQDAAPAEENPGDGDEDNNSSNNNNSSTTDNTDSTDGTDNTSNNDSNNDNNETNVKTGYTNIIVVMTLLFAVSLAAAVIVIKKSKAIK